MLTLAVVLLSIALAILLWRECRRRHALRLVERRIVEILERRRAAGD